MRQRLTWLVLLSATIAVTALYHTRNVLATSASGFTSTTLALGRFGEIDVFNHLIPPNLWQSRQKTRGCQTCTSRATSGTREEPPAGTLTLAIA
jgi:hypothetical protein